MNTNKTVLIVDDQPDFLENMSLTLNAAGYRAVVAANGLQALAMLRSQPVDMILSDIGMPEMGGYQLYKQVRQHSHWHDIPFVFLTGYEYLSESEILYGKSLGINGYLTKPVRALELLEAVENTLSAEQRVTA